MTESLNDVMYRYKEYLLQQRQQVQENHQRDESLRNEH